MGCQFLSLWKDDSMERNKGMSRDMYEHIKNNIHKLKEINVEDGYVVTVKGSNGTIDNGYLRIKLNKRAVMVHQIIAVKLFGEKCIGLQVNHKDGNKLNNKSSNLELTTKQENIKHGFDNGLYENSKKRFAEMLYSIKGEDKSNAKLTEDDVRFIRNDTSHTNTELARKFGVDPKAIRNVKQYKTWKHVS